jgi:hypothetical protein
MSSENQKKYWKSQIKSKKKALKAAVKIRKKYRVLNAKGVS